MPGTPRKKRLKRFFQVLSSAFTDWKKFDPFRQSATVAYYAIFSIPALLVIVVAFAGFVFGQEAVRGELSRQIGSAIGHDSAKQVEDIIATAGMQKSSVWAAIISIVTLIVGSTGVFGQLQTSLNEIWEVKAAPSGKKKWLKMLRDRLLSFGLVLSIGFLMLISLAITSVLAAIGGWIQTRWPGITVFLFEGSNFLISLGIFTLLFALMYKILPDAKVPWRDIWPGALLTSLLFMLGKFAIGFYFGKANPGSAYGAAGSVILMMLWVSYSCMILFFGATFTKQHALLNGRNVKPLDYAVKKKEILIKS